MSYTLKEAILKGVSLDVLLFFTSKYSTSLNRSDLEIRQRYNHIVDFNRLLQELIDLQLLTRPTINNDKNHWNQTVPNDQVRLAHDTLAPIIIRLHDQSKNPGQIARRMLESKLLVKDNVLSEKELKIIRQGQAGMRKLIKSEENLISESESKISTQKKRRNRIFWLIFILLGVLSGVILWTNNDRIISSRYIDAKNAFEAENYGISLQHSYKNILQTNDTQSRHLFFDAAINYAITEGKVNSNEFLSVFKGNRLRKHPKDDRLFIVSDDTTQKSIICYYNTNKEIEIIDTLNGRLNTISSDGQFLITTLKDQQQTAYVFIINQDLTVSPFDTISGVRFMFSEDQKTILSVNDISPYNEDTIFTSVYRRENEAFKFLGDSQSNLYKISPNGKYLLLQPSYVIQDLLLLYHIDGSNLDFIDTIRSTNGDFTKDCKYLRTYTLTGSAEFRGSILHLLNGSKKPKTIKSPNYIDLTPWSDYFIFRDDNNKILKLIKHNKAKTIQVIDELICILSKEDELYVLYDEKDRSLYQYNWSPNYSPPLRKAKQLTGIDAKNVLDSKTFLTQDESKSYIYRKNKNSTYALVKEIPYTRNRYYFEKYLTFSSSDSSHVFIEDSSSNIKKLTTVPGYMYIYPSQNLNYITTKYNNNFYLKNIHKDTYLSIIGEDAINGDHWIGENSIYLFSKNTNQILLWHTPPLELEPKELFNCFDEEDLHIE